MIDPAVTDWMSMIVRWIHVTAAMAWIGGSFYFMETDLKLKKRDGLPPGVAGEAWQVHGGSFYNMTKYTVAPARMPIAASPGISGIPARLGFRAFALLILVYYMQADLFLIDKSVMNLTPWEAGLFSLVSLLLAWFAYDLLCRSPLGKHDIALAVIVYIFLVIFILRVHAGFEWPRSRPIRSAQLSAHSWSPTPFLSFTTNSKS